MLKMNFWFGLTGGLALGVFLMTLRQETITPGTSNLNTKNNNPHTLSTPIQDAQPQAELFALQDSLKQYAQKNHELKKEVEQLRVQLSLVVAAPPSVPDTAHTLMTEQLAKLYAREANAQIEQVKQHITALEDKHQSTANYALAREFELEPIDEQWASEQANQLDTYFNEDTHLQNTAIIENECRQSQCKLSFMQTSTDGDTPTSFDIYNAVNKNSEWQSFVTTTNPDTGTTSLYLHRQASAPY